MLGVVVFVYSDAMDWGIALECEDAASSNSCHNDDASECPPSTPIKLHGASTCTPTKTFKSVVQARTLLARMRLAQAMRAEKMSSKSVSSAGRLQQLAEARRKKAEIGAKKKLFKSNDSCE